MSKTSARRHRRSRHAGRARARARALALALAFIPICLGLGWWSASVLRGADAAVAVLGDGARAPETPDGTAARADGATRGDLLRDAPARTTAADEAEAGTDAAIAIAMDRIPAQAEHPAAITADAIGLPVPIGSGRPAAASTGDAGQAARDGAAADAPARPIAASGAAAGSATVGWPGVAADPRAGVAAGSGLPVGGPGGPGGLGAGGTAFANVPASGSTRTALSGQALARTAEVVRSLDSSDLESVGAGAGGHGAGPIHRPNESAVSSASEPPPAPLLLSKVDPSDPTFAPLAGVQDPDPVQPVPAPSTALLLLAGLGMLLRHGRRRRED